MGKFFLGVFVGGVTGIVGWNLFRKTDYYQQVQEIVQNAKNNSNESEIDQVVEEVKAEIEEVKDAVK